MLLIWCKSYKTDGTVPAVLSAVLAHLPYFVGAQKNH